MTKVISAHSDDVGGCSKAHPESASGSGSTTDAPAGEGKDKGIHKGVMSHGPRSFEQPFGNLR
jgi:hypothetical protein